MQRVLRDAPGSAGALGRHPRENAVEKNEVAQQAERVPDQALTIAPKPIDFGQPAAPAVALPGLQSDAQYPAGALPNGGSHGTGKEFARGHDAGAMFGGVMFGERHEHLLAGEFVEAQAVLIILGETSRLED